MSPTGVEIERKFRLAAAPRPDVLAAHGAEALRIEQVYLAPPPEGRRVRRIEHADGTVELRLTRKGAARGISRSEVEHAITPEEYDAYLRAADPGRRPIRKTRHVVGHGRQHLEIDVFESPPGLVVVEVELESEDETVELPAWLGEHREVTDDPAYLNWNLARLDAEVPPA